MENKKTDVSKDLSGEVITVRRELKGKVYSLVYWFSVFTSLFHLWINTIGIMPEIQRNALHYGLILFLGFIVIL